MPDTANKQNAKPFQIVSRGKAIEYLNIAIIAGCSTEVEDPERFFKTEFLKTHVYNILITKTNQHKCNYSKQVHPYYKKVDGLLYLQPRIRVSYQSKKQNHNNNFNYSPQDTDAFKPETVHQNSCYE